MVSLEERISAGGEQDGDEVVLEHQHRGREVHHLDRIRSKSIGSASPDRGI